MDYIIIKKHSGQGTSQYLILMELSLTLKSHQKYHRRRHYH